MSAAAAHFEIYNDTQGDWRWRLRARNGRIVADSAEGYASKRNAKNAVMSTLDAVEGALIAGVRNATGAAGIQEVAR
jgi:uncharacterized protein YegP (UPF0339 family)